MIEIGCRKSEILRAKWEDISQEDTLLKLPETKAGKRQFVPLSPSTLCRLLSLSNSGDYIFPSSDGTSHRKDIKRQWDRIRKEAALEGVRIHDIRRTFGLSIAKIAGLQTASILLRHSNIKITHEHYAQLGLDDLRPHLEKRTADVISLEDVAKKEKRSS